MRTLFVRINVAPPSCNATDDKRFFQRICQSIGKFAITENGMFSYEADETVFFKGHMCVRSGVVEFDIEISDGYERINWLIEAGIRHAVQQAISLS